MYLFPVEEYPVLVFDEHDTSTVIGLAQSQVEAAEVFTVRQGRRNDGGDLTSVATRRWLKGSGGSVFSSLAWLWKCVAGEKGVDKRIFCLIGHSWMGSRADSDIGRAILQFYHKISLHFTSVFHSSRVSYLKTFPDSATVFSITCAHAKFFAKQRKSKRKKK